MLEEHSPDAPQFLRPDTLPSQGNQGSDLHQSEHSDETFDSDESGVSSADGLVEEESGRLDLDRIRARYVSKPFFLGEEPRR